MFSFNKNMEDGHLTLEHMASGFITTPQFDYTFKNTYSFYYSGAD